MFICVHPRLSVADSFLVVATQLWWGSQFLAAAAFQGGDPSEAPLPGIERNR